MAVSILDYLGIKSNQGMISRKYYRIFTFKSGRYKIPIALLVIIFLMSGQQKLQLAERLYFKFTNDFDKLFPNNSPKTIVAKIRNLYLTLAIELTQNDEELKDYCISRFKEMQKQIYQL